VAGRRCCTWRCRESFRRASRRAVGKRASDPASEPRDSRGCESRTTVGAHQARAARRGVLRGCRRARALAAVAERTRAVRAGGRGAPTLSSKIFPRCPPCPSHCRARKEGRAGKSYDVRTGPRAVKDTPKCAGSSAGSPRSRAVQAPEAANLRPMSLELLRKLPFSTEMLWASCSSALRRDASESSANGGTFCARSPAHNLWTSEAARRTGQGNQTCRPSST
jgi:hypothetical protein